MAFEWVLRRTVVFRGARLFPLAESQYHASVRRIGAEAKVVVFLQIKVVPCVHYILKRR